MLANIRNIRNANTVNNCLIQRGKIYIKSIYISILIYYVIKPKENNYNCETTNYKPELWVEGQNMLRLMGNVVLCPLVT